MTKGKIDKLALTKIKYICASKDTTKKVKKKKGPSIEHSELNSVSCNNL